MPDVILGNDVATGRKIPINDIDRRSGLYVLGIQGSGKTTLLKNLIFQDIRNGHGVFFLDPHGDAIEDLLAHIPAHRKEDVFVLDPTDDIYTFGINLFSCLNPDSLRERSASYAQAEHIFTKLFANPQTEELDILLSEYLPNAFYPLIANQGLTLLEIPLLLRQKTFRDRLLQSSSIPAETLDFWQEEFEALRADTQREETASTRRRINLFRTHEYVKHIVGQSRTTVDFTDIMDSGKILFVKLSSTLAPRVRDLIGTMLVSNLVAAVLRRESIPEAKRHHFCIFVDEFQNFASSEDFAVLFTQARKYNVATTVAHQERYGQFADNKRMLGATDTAGNKIFLQQSQSDAQRHAVLFAKEPPTETRRERILIISQNPVGDILKGHANPQVQAFATEYLRSLADRLEDTKAEMEGERIKRQGHLDVAGYWRAHSGGEDDPFNPYRRLRMIKASQGGTNPAMTAMAAAGEHSARLLTLYESAESLRRVMRSLDTFLPHIMEGRIAKGQEAYARSLLEIVAVFFPITLPLALYITLAYGDSSMSRRIPFALASATRQLSAEATAIEKRLYQELADRTAREDALFYAQEQEKFKKDFDAFLAVRMKIHQGRRECVKEQLFFGKTPAILPLIVKDLVKAYLPLLAYPQVHQALSPFFTARFVPSWQGQFLQTSLASWLRDGLQSIREDNRREREFIKEHYVSWDRLRRRRQWSPQEYDNQEARRAKESFAIMFQDGVLDRFEQFVGQYGQGALVALVLLVTAASPDRFQWLKSMYRWNPRYTTAETAQLPDSWFGSNQGSHYWDRDFVRYPGFHMLSIPHLEGHQPLAVLWLLQQLNILLAPQSLETDCRNYYWCGSSPSDTFSWSRLNPLKKRYLRFDPYDPAVLRSSPGRKEGYSAKYSGWQYKEDILVRNTYQPRRFKELLESREDVQFLNKLVEGDPRSRSLYRLVERHCGGSTWQNWLVIYYLQARACDLANFGLDIADLTFPEPTLTGATGREVSDTVSWMAGLFQKRMRSVEQQEDAEVTAKLQKEQQVRRAHRPPKALVPKLPDYLPSRILSGTEIESVKKACLAQLSGSSVLTVITDVVNFCDLLARPENHIQVPSSQYRETQVNLYSTQEMVNQMEQELLDLRPPFAYVKSAWKGKIETFPFRPSAQEVLVDMRRGARENAINRDILKPRSVVEAEIRERQERWRQGGPGSQPPPTTGGSPPALPSGQDGEPPPPTSYNPATPSEEKPPKSENIARPQERVVDFTAYRQKLEQEHNASLPTSPDPLPLQTASVLPVFEPLEAEALGNGQRAQGLLNETAGHGPFTAALEKRREKHSARSHTMFCYHCGQKLPDKAHFCFTCGTATVTETSMETAHQTQDVSTRAVAVRTYTGELLPAQPNSEGVKPPGHLTPYAPERAVTTAVPEVPLNEKIRQLLTKVEGTCRTHALREALHLCTHALKQDKNNSEVYLLQGELLEETQRYQEALFAYEQAIKLGSMPTSVVDIKAEASERKVRLLCSFREYKKALDTLDASIKSFPQRDSLYSLKIKVLTFLNRPSEQVARTQREQQQLSQLLREE